MTEEERVLLKEMAAHNKTFNEQMKDVLHRLIVLAIVVISALVISNLITIISFNVAMTKCVETYFSEDYLYPEMTQDITQDVSQIVEKGDSK